MEKLDLKSLSIKELDEQIKAEQANLLTLKMNHALTPIENPLKIRFTRRMIARLKNERGIRILKEKKSVK